MKSICSINGTIKNQSEAILPLSDIEAQYGFGVYETIKYRNTILYFIDQHIDRLFFSAKQLSLEHNFQKKQIATYIQEFITELEESACNIKLLLYGNEIPEQSNLIILASSPFYPNRKWYKEGIKLMTYSYERWMPQAKSLNMVASYYIYKKAQQNNCYDALLIDNNKNILEGTRANVYLIKNKTIYSPLKDKILEGVTMMSLEKVLQDTEYKIKYKNIKLDSISTYDGMFLTSTSSKILPIKQIDSFTFKEISAEIFNLIRIYDDALAKCNGDFDLL